MEKYFIDQQLSHNALGAVVFNAESFDASGQVRRDVSVTYKIRLRAEQYNGTYQSQTSKAGDWLTSHMFPRLPSVGPRGDMFGGRQPG